MKAGPSNLVVGGGRHGPPDRERQAPLEGVDETAEHFSKVIRVRQVRDASHSVVGDPWIVVVRSLDAAGDGIRNPNGTDRRLVAIAFFRRRFISHTATRHFALRLAEQSSTGRAGRGVFEGRVDTITMGLVAAFREANAVVVGRDRALADNADDLARWRWHRNVQALSQSIALADNADDLARWRWYRNVQALSQSIRKTFRSITFDRLRARW